DGEGEAAREGLAPDLDDSFKKFPTAAGGLTVVNLTRRPLHVPALYFTFATVTGPHGNRKGTYRFDIRGARRACLITGRRPRGACGLEFAAGTVGGMSPLRARGF
ncbi:MAG TPA: hypothetical protein VK422_06910, partial [Pyrinomonadaceae bacterium]|nr:hypothetical protein [Pyrinomonadaceae bacterium]